MFLTICWWRALGSKIKYKSSNFRNFYFLLSKDQTDHCDLVSSILCVFTLTKQIRKVKLRTTWYVDKYCFQRCSSEWAAVSRCLSFFNLWYSNLWPSRACLLACEIWPELSQVFLHIIASHIELLNTFYFLCGWPWVSVWLSRTQQNFGHFTLDTLLGRFCLLYTHSFYLSLAPLIYFFFIF